MIGFDIAQSRVRGTICSYSRYVPALAVACWLAACGGGSSAAPIIGSGKVVESKTATMVVESVQIYLPFKAVVHNGSARQIVITGEDNLISKITVDEPSVSKWEIVAPEDLQFEQHDDLQIDIPYIDMVEIMYSGDLTFADQPLTVWHPDGGTGGAGAPTDSGSSM
jgi:hypothetical protein